MHHRGHAALVAILSIAMLFTVACSSITTTITLTVSGDAPPTLDATASKGTDYQVVIQNALFTPLEINIKPGDTVTWVNRDGEPHTITSVRYAQDEDEISHVYIGETWDSGDIRPGASFSRTFQAEGTYLYFSFPLDKPYPIPEFYQLMAGKSVGSVIVK